jgi:5-methylthioadenosine/S-adenosylhomocysteine deaminase
MKRGLFLCVVVLILAMFAGCNRSKTAGSAAPPAESGAKSSKVALVEDIRLDFANPDSFISDKDVADFSAACRQNDIVPVIGLMAEEDYETGRLRRVFEKLKNIDALQTLHLAENEWRRDLIQKKYGLTPIEYLKRNGFLHDKLIGSHVVYAGDDEVKWLKMADVKVVNTPLCEMKIADGIAPIPEMVRQGVRVGLGTDGALWNNSNDIFREMKGMSLLHTVNEGIRCLSKKDILDMATVHGAAIFGKGGEIGLIKEGMKADMILVDTGKPHMRPLLLGKHENVISGIIFNVTGGDVRDVFIDGRRIVQNGVLTTIDVSAVSARVQKAAEKIICSI